MSSPSVTLDFTEISNIFKVLQARIIAAFEAEEVSHSKATFTLTPWEKTPGDKLQGGGIMALMRGGPDGVFEKVGVNFSNVHGVFDPAFAKEIPGALENGGAFKATGVSLVAHMANPFCPSVHMNVRRIETSKGWFGGGADLTPTFEFAEDTAHFHDTLKAACDTLSPTAYAEYKKWCDTYFMLPHRGEARGVGGIFFDYLETPSPATLEQNFAFVQAVGQAFIDGFVPLVARRKATPFTADDKHQQNLKRGRYAEFNLLYDRGTRFGLQTGGNTEAILMSLPPSAAW
jgi:coproporphyrinogen III oxidase